MTEEEARRQEAVVEAVLFTMGRSVETRELAAALECEDAEAEAAAERLARRYGESGACGMQIIRLEKRWQMCTKKEYYDALIRVAKAPKKQTLSNVVLETLSIIAYKQPVTKTEISKIRGVSSDFAVNKLVEYGLVYEAGRLDAPGRPALFATTEEFLRRFGVDSRKDLPTVTPDQEAEIAQEVEKEVKYRFGLETSETEAQESAEDAAGTGKAGADTAGTGKAETEAAAAGKAEADTDSTGKAETGQEPSPEEG